MSQQESPVGQGSEELPLILAVDDAPVNLAIIRAMLDKTCRLITAESGQKALELAAKTPQPALILLDVMMPTMDGFTVLKKLKASAETRDIPVIFVTALAEDEDEYSGLSLGAVDYLTKPLRRSILCARVHNQIELKRSRDLLQRQNETLETLVQERTRSLEAALADQKTLNRRLEDAQNHLLQAEKMASLGQLAAGVAHEINNPVGFVHSNLGSLANEVDDLLVILDAAEKAARLAPDGPEFAAFLKLKREKDFDYLRDDLRSIVGESREGLERVSRIVQDLKNFSRIGEVSWEWADLHACIDSTLNIVWNELKYKCEIVKEYAKDLPLVHCIPSQLNQVFMNLLLNAAQAISEHGSIRITSHREGPDHVSLSFRDTGKGIPKEVLSRIFDPFFTTKPVGQGTGLGLSIAWGIVARHQGRIEVESEPGKGSCFTIQLPLNPPLLGSNDTP